MAEFRPLTGSPTRAASRGLEPPRGVIAQIPGRFMLPDRSEYPCVTTYISGFETTIKADVKPQLNERVVLYLRDFGRIEGRACQISQRDFVLAMQVPDVKRAKIEECLKVIASRGTDEASRRRHERITPLHRLCALKTASGERIVSLIDLSISGAAFSSQDPKVQSLTFGEEVQLGSRPSVVTRITDSGACVEFKDGLEEAVFDETIIL